MSQTKEQSRISPSVASPQERHGWWLPLVLAVCVFPYVFVAGVLYTGTRLGDPLYAIARAYAAFTIWLPLWCGGLGIVSLIGWKVLKRAECRAAVFFALGLAALSFSARVYATHIEPNLLFVRQVQIRTPKVDRPIRVLHLTDIQTDKVGAHDRRVFARIRELNPDLIIHTGDLLHPVRPATYESELPKMAELWATVNPPLGKYNVIGDTDPPIMRQLLAGGEEVGGLRTLHAEDDVVTVGKTRLRLRGLTLGQTRGGQGMQAQVARWLAEGQEPNDFNILFGHAPDFVLFLNGMPRVDLCLAGHTHGGQIQIPFYGPLITFSAVPRRWAHGFHKTPDFRLNVSAGVGAEHAAGMPAIRVNCPPEMTLIELLPPK